jgi:hypothetical protein
MAKQRLLMLYDVYTVNGVVRSDLIKTGGDVPTPFVPIPINIMNTESGFEITAMLDNDFNIKYTTKIASGTVIHHDVQQVVALVGCAFNNLVTNKIYEGEG